MQSEQEAEVGVQSWSLICDTLLSRGLEPGLLFQLRQGEVGAGLALLQYYIRCAGAAALRGHPHPPLQHHRAGAQPPAGQVHPQGKP